MTVMLLEGLNFIDLFASLFFIYSFVYVNFFLPLNLSSDSIQAQRHTNRGASVPTDVYSSLFLSNGPKVHIGVGCDFCGVSPREI